MQHTVKSLIAELSKYPENLLVVIDTDTLLCSKLDISRATYEMDDDGRPAMLDYIQIKFDV